MVYLSIMKHLNIAVTDELWETMKQVSIIERRPVSYLVRQALAVAYTPPLPLARGLSAALADLQKELTDKAVAGE